MPRDTPKADRQAWFQKVFECDADADDDEEVQEDDADKIVKQKTLNHSF